MIYNPLLMVDFYKCVHSEQYPKDMSMIYSTGTPRMSRLNDIDTVVHFGTQAFCKEYLIEAFNTYFFNRPIEEVVAEYTKVLNYTLGKGTYNAQKIIDLHKLGYLPIAVYAVPEGQSTKIGVPNVVFVNTHPKFAWLTNTLETAYSAYIWHLQISAEVGKRYRTIVQKYRDMTCDDNIRVSSLLGDFSMRGQHSPESAMRSSAAWLLSFRNTATVPAIMWLEDMYNCDCSKDEVGFGAISTEHSVMCSNFAVDGDEITHIKRLLTEIYSNSNFSMVSDSYDYWNLVDNILPQCKDEIMAHNGYLAVRGDSGDPVEVIAGKKIEYLEADDFYTKTLLEDPAWWAKEECESEEFERYYYHPSGKYYHLTARPIYGTEEGAWSGIDYEFIESWEAEVEEVQPNGELLGTVWALWQQFGGTVNSKGYKVLDPHIKALYGDSITPQRCEEIYYRLKNQGFAVNNCVLGVGSFSFMCLETVDNEGTHYSPYTRDTFGYAIKATYGEDKDENPVMIFKQPKALAWKKSQRGCCIVAPDGMSYTDGHTFDYAHETMMDKNLLQQVFKNGLMMKEYTLDEIRNNMWGKGAF